MRRATIVTLKAFLIELVVYAVLVFAYFLLVLHLLGGWLNELSGHHRYIYAITALLLILVQAVFLDAVTTILLRLVRGRSE